MKAPRTSKLTAFVILPLGLDVVAELICVVVRVDGWRMLYMVDCGYIKGGCGELGVLV